MISTKGRYALRVMIDLAEQHSDSYVPLKDVAERQGGGYRLSRDPSEYTVGEILELMEGTLSSVACLANPEYNCPRVSACRTLPMWKEFDKMVHDFFYGRTLKDLMVSS